MGFGDIIKRSWRITWRYRALWVLGLFAGITGGSTGGGSNYRSSSSGSGTDLGAERFFRGLDPTRWTDQLAHYLPAIVAGTLLLVAIGFVLWIIGIAARGGLIQAVDAIEDGHPFSLGAAWDAGFGRFWRLLGLSLLLGLPVALVGFGLAVAIVLTVFSLIRHGAQAAPAAFVPVCGAFALGLPLLIVGGVILGTMQLLGSRSVMLEDAGVFEAAGKAWHTFRTRIKDTLIMWFITLGLNMVASLAVAIPLAIILVAAALPAIFLVRSQAWWSLAGISAGAVLVVTLLLMLYTAIWGTFTSALWTVFFRRLTGREALVAPVAAAPIAAPPAAPAARVAPAAPMPPVTPAVPVPPFPEPPAQTTPVAEGPQTDV